MITSSQQQSGAGGNGLSPLPTRFDHPAIYVPRREATAEQRGLLFPLHQIKPASAKRVQIFGGVA